jgi:hypothetical protein
MTYYVDVDALLVHVDDVPAFPVVANVDNDDEATDLDWVTSQEAVYTSPLGVDTDLDAPDLTNGTVTINWPTDASLFTDPGLGFLTVTLKGAGSLSAVVEPIQVIAELPGRWLTCAQARRVWDDANDLDNGELWALLESARRACIEYAPAIDESEPLPPTYRQAQLIQARNTWEATRAGGIESVGPEGFSVVRHPLDWQVKQLLRPKSMPPVVT